MERPIQAFKTSKQVSTSKKPQSHTDFHERLQKLEASKQVTSKKPQSHINFGESIQNLQGK